MNADTVLAVPRRWIGRDSTPNRRSIAATVLLVVGAFIGLVGIPKVIGEGFGLLFVVLVVLGAGIFAHAWRVIPIAYVTVVLTLCVMTLGELLWYGADGWEARNADHWQGDMSVTMKVLGQLMENALIPLFFMVPVLAFGVLLYKMVEIDRTDIRNQQEPQPY